jgi:hypothetical protein
MSILASLEQRGVVWNRMSFETPAAARQFAGELNQPVSAAVLAQGTAASAGCPRQMQLFEGHPKESAARLLEKLKFEARVL